MIGQLDKLHLIGQIVAAADNLRSEDGENPEYDRAIAELTIDTVGIVLGLGN
jgi:hypothetical protein